MDLLKAISLVLSFILSVGVINIIFSVIWKLLATLLSSLLQDVGIHKDYSFLFFKTLGYYILVSVCGVFTAIEMDGAATSAMSVTYGVVGTFLIYTTIAGNLERNRWRAVMNFERKRLRVMRYDGWLLLLAVSLFAVTMSKPEIASNGVVTWFFETMYQVYHRFDLLKWIIRIGAFFYTVSMVVKGINATRYLIALLLFSPNPLKSHDQNRPPHRKKPNDTNDEGYTDYEEVE